MPPLAPCDPGASTPSMAHLFPDRPFASPTITARGYLLLHGPAEIALRDGLAVLEANEVFDVQLRVDEDARGLRPHRRIGLGGRRHLRNGDVVRPHHHADLPGGSRLHFPR